MTARVAVVGIDGSGKTSVIERLCELVDDNQAGAVAMHCPDFHDNRDVPAAELSRQLRAVGEAADRASDARIKAATLFLRITMFGQVEKFLRERHRPGLMISERHPIVETMVYAPVYQRLVASSRTPDETIAAIFADADRQCRGASAALLDWQAQIVARSGLAADLPTVVDDVAALVSGGPAAAAAALGEVCETTLPDLVLWLDTPPEVCAARLAQRAEREIHEDPATLRKLRARYEQTSQEVAEEFGPAMISRVDVTGLDGVEAYARRCLAAVEFAGLA